MSARKRRLFVELSISLKMRASFRVIATLLSLVVAAAAEGPLTPLQSLRIYTINRWLKPSSTPLQIAAVASLRGGGGGEVSLGGSSNIAP